MGMRGAKTASLFVTVVAVIALASGCSGDAPEPSRLDEGNGGDEKVEQTPTPTPTPAPTEPQLDDHEQELYDATVTFYDTINEAYKTLDTAPIEKLLVPGSNAASGYTNYIEDTKAKGHRFVDVGEYRVSDFNLEVDGDASIETVTFALGGSGLREVDAKGDEVNNFSAQSGGARITFKKQGDTWLVVTQDILD